MSAVKNAVGATMEDSATLSQMVLRMNLSTSVHAHQDSMNLIVRVGNIRGASPSIRDIIMVFVNFINLIICSENTTM